MVTKNALHIRICEGQVTGYEQLNTSTNVVSQRSVTRSVYIYYVMYTIDDHLNLVHRTFHF